MDDARCKARQTDHDIKEMLKNAVEHSKTTVSGCGLFYKGKVVEIKLVSQHNLDVELLQFRVVNCSKNKLSLTLVSRRGSLKRSKKIKVGKELEILKFNFIVENVSTRKIHLKKINRKEAHASTRKTQG